MADSTLLSIQARCRSHWPTRLLENGSLHAFCTLGSGAHPQPLIGPALAKEFEDDSAATLQYGHWPLSNLPYPQLPCTLATQV